MPVKDDQKVTHDNNKITISRPSYKTLAFVTYDEDLYRKISSVTWTVKRSESGKEYLTSSKYGLLHQLVISYFYGEDVLKEAYKNQLVIDHLDNNGYECVYENLALIPRKENSAKGLTYDIERKEAMDKYAINITRDMDTKEFQISVIFNKEANLNMNNEEIPLHILYFRYGNDFKTAFIDARSILNDLDSNGRVNLANLRYKDFDYKKTERIFATPEQIKAGFFIKDGEIYGVQGSPHFRQIKANHNENLHTRKCK